jgi:hypothetical protein
MSKDITITVSIPEVNMMLQAMTTLPINPGLDLLNKVRGQAEAQAQAQIQAEQAAQVAADKAAKADAEAKALAEAEPKVMAEGE